jgi:hypothetical protein
MRPMISLSSWNPQVRWLWAALACVPWALGCQPTDSTSSSQSSIQPSPSSGSKSDAPPPSPGSPDDAKRLVSECLTRYQKLSRYVDNGELSIEAPGVTAVRSPFRIAWERPNRLAMAVHSMRGCWTSTTWEAHCDGNANPFPKQRLVRPLPDRIDLEWLMSDNLGGLFNDPVGLPIQLELLLANRSLQTLTDDASQLEFLQRDTADGRACDRIRVERDGLRWTLWIDRENQLLRRMELPPQLFYPNLTGDALTGVRCEIELRGASADTEIDWTGWQVPARPEDVLVRRFVIPPPIASTRVLGTTLEPFDLKDAAGELLLDSAEPKRPISILCWIGEDAVSEGFVRELMTVRRILVERELSGRSQIFLIGQESAKSISETLKQWNCDLPLAIDRDGATRALFQIPGEPSLIILDRDRRVQVSEYVAAPAVATAIPSLVQRIDAKEDLASRQLQQDADNQARYIAALHRVAIDKSETAKLDAIREFQFALHGMVRRDWRATFSEPLLSAGGAWYPEVATGAVPPPEYPFSGNQTPHVMAALDETGKIHVVDDLGNVREIGRVEIEQADGALRIHTAIDPWTHRWIAVVPEGLPRFWIAPIETSPGERSPIAPTPPRSATTYNTQDSESPVAFAWTAIDKQPALAVATTESRLLVINPKTEQRLDAIGEGVVAIAPGLDALGRVAEWNTITGAGRLTRIRNLTGASGALDDTPIEARLEQLSFKPLQGLWLWGRHGEDAVTLSLAGLPSGETGVMVCGSLHQVLRSRPITVRPEQTRLLNTARTQDGTLYGLAIGPNRVLHLFSADLMVMDQVSFQSKILSAALYASGSDLKMVVALENEISAWSIDVPDRLAAPPTAVSPTNEPIAPSTP